MGRKTVIVTGASRGIGKAVAVRFAREGYNVVVNGTHNRELLEKVCEEIRQMGVDCLAISADVGNHEEVAVMLQQVKERFGQVDVLVNNAGISKIGLLQDLSPEEWNQIVTTNLTSVYNTCHCVVPLMLHSGSGSIVNVSSVWGMVGASCEVAYSATKGGINAFTRALGKELAPERIRVNAVACGAIRTTMNAFLSEEEEAALLEEIPMGRMGTPEEAAELVYDVATGTAYLTAQIIQLDGGWI